MAIFLSIGAVLAGTVTVIYNREAAARISQVEVAEEHSVRIIAEMIDQTLAVVFSDLRYLAEQDDLGLWLANGDNAQLAALNREFQHFSNSRQIYDQIRFLDLKGQEVSRVNFNNGNSIIVEPEKLQNKIRRYYFQEAIILGKGETYASPFDLNVEQQQVEQPLKPMIRFAMVVFDQHGQKRGLILLNYLGQQLLDNIEKISALSPGEIQLLNPAGYRFCGGVIDQRWGFMFPSRSHYVFKADNPLIWQEMLASADFFQQRMANGLYTGITISPLQMANISNVLVGQGERWHLVSIFPAAQIAALGQSLRVKLFGLGALLFVLAALPAYFIAQYLLNRKAHALEMEHLANFDRLTDLPNRTLFRDRLQQAIFRASRRQDSFVLLFMDLDGFKGVNDRFGHNSGDELLVTMGARLTNLIRQSDTVARLGGDEFTVLLGDIADESNGLQVAEKIITVVNQPFVFKGKSVQVGASIGMAVFPEHGSDGETLLNAADQAMYAAKKAGKNRVVKAS